VVNVGCIYSSPQTERVQFILIVESDFTNFYLLQLSNYFRLGLDQVLSFFGSSNHIDPSTPFFFLSQPGLWPGVWGRRADQKGEEKLQGVPRAADVFFSSPEFGIQNGGWR
jgi:hypothetical protein